MQVLSKYVLTYMQPVANIGIVQTCVTMLPYIQQIVNAGYFPNVNYDTYNQHWKLVIFLMWTTIHTTSSKYWLFS